MGFHIEYRDRVTGHVQSFRAHAHDYYEIYSYFGGEGIYLYYVGDNMYELTAGDVVICRPGVLHSSFKKSKTQYRRLYVRLPAHAVENLKDFSADVYWFLKSGAAHIHPAGDSAAAYGKLMQEILFLRKQPYTPEKELLLYAKVVEQLVLLYQAAKIHPTSETNTEESILIRQIIAYINENYASIRGISDIADAFSYSKNHLSTLFRREMNHGLHEFLTEKRLSVAAAKLLTGESVTECALSCGFGSLSYFISVFKKFYGMTPKEYQTTNIVQN